MEKYRIVEKRYYTGVIDFRPEYNVDDTGWQSILMYNPLNFSLEYATYEEALNKIKEFIKEIEKPKRIMVHELGTNCDIELELKSSHIIKEYDLSKYLEDICNESILINDHNHYVNDFLMKKLEKTDENK
jgi:hypothetical protein